MPDTPRTLAQLVTALADNSIGAITPQNLRDLLVSVLPTIVEQRATADTNVGIATVDLTGATITVAVPAVGGFLDIWFEFDFDGNASVAALNQIFGYAYLDGVQVNVPVIYTFASSGARATLNGRTIQAVAGGSHTVKLTAIRFGGTGTAIVRATQSKLIVSVLPTAAPVTDDAGT